MYIVFSLHVTVLFSLSLLAGPRVTTQPCNHKATVGHDAFFSVVVEGTGHIRFKWWYVAPGKQNWRPLSDDDEQYYGVDCSTLKIRSITESLEGSYKCTIHDDLGETSSKVVVLAVCKWRHVCLNN